MATIIDENERKFTQVISISDEFDSIKYSHCIFLDDFFLNAKVENNVEFIECTFEGNARLFIQGGEYKKDFTLSFKKLHWLQITGGNFNNFHVGYWGDRSIIDEINIDKMQNIEGKIKISKVSCHSLLLRGQNEKTQLIFEDCDFSLISAYYFINKSALRFQNIKFLNTDESAEFNIQDSNMATTEFFYVNFKSFNAVNFRNSFIANCIFMGCDFSDNIFAKVGRGVANPFDSANLEIKTLEDRLNKYEEEEFEKLFEISKSDGYVQLLKEKLKLKNLKIADTKNQIKYRVENYKQLKYSFSKTGDRINEKLFHGKEMEEYLKMDISIVDKFILKLSKYSSDFGQSLLRPIIFNGLIHLLFCILLFSIYKYDGFYVTLQDATRKDTLAAFKEGLYLALPLKSFNKEILFFDIFMKINAGFFIYNMLRASRKFYH